MLPLLKEFKVYAVPMDQIDLDENFNCRLSSNDEKVPELATNIAKYGLQTPILVWQQENGYKLIAGHRRYRAFQKLGKVEITARIMPHDYDYTLLKIINLCENSERKDISPLEEARAIVGIFPDDTPIPVIAKAMHKTYDWVRRRRLMLAYPEDIQLGWHTKHLHIRDTESLQTISDLDERYEAARRLMETRKHRKVEGGTVRSKIIHKSPKQIREMITWLGHKELSGPAMMALLWAVGELSDNKFKRHLNKILDSPFDLLMNGAIYDEFKRYFPDASGD
jgi:ParB/RepB/Spo0J family partition protein